jgi:hypothetical protein
MYRASLTISLQHDISDLMNLLAIALCQAPLICTTKRLSKSMLCMMKIATFICPRLSLLQQKPLMQLNSTMRHAKTKIKI